jgi:DNA-binding transcriptional LysR family regulator
MRRRDFIGFVSSAAAWPIAARAQQPTITVIGFLSSASPEAFAPFRTAGLEPPRAQVLSLSIPLHQHLLATGRFLTTLPLSMLVYSQHLSFKPVSVEFPAHPRPIGIVTLRNRTLSPLARIFIEGAREVGRSLEKRR